MNGWGRLRIVAMAGALAWFVCEPCGVVLAVGLQNTVFAPWWAPWLVAVMACASVIAWVALGFRAVAGKNIRSRIDGADEFDLAPKFPVGFRAEP